MTMRFDHSLSLPAPREAVWRLVADTDRVNRELGLPPIRFTFEPQTPGGSETHAEIRIAGRTLRYREHPFEWARPAFYRVRRTFKSGPLREIRVGVNLEPEGDGTRLLVWTEIDPANALGQALGRAVGAKSVADFAAVCRRFGDYLSNRATNPYPRHSSRPPADRARLAQALDRLCEVGADPELAARLTEHLAQAPPEDITALRPFVLADAWGVERLAMLRLCLLAARVGLLNLEWRVLCPYCRGGKPGVSHLDRLPSVVHCEACNIRFDAAFDRRVEVCFCVASAIRPVRVAIYCMGGPAVSPHAFAQWVLAPGEGREMALEAPPGDYTLTSLQADAPRELRVDPDGCGASEALVVRFDPGDSHARISLDPDVGEAAVASRARWTLVNKTNATVTLRLETPAGATEAATAALVTSLQAFRDQFSSEVLSPGVELSVQQICILFSDLKGSTALYRVRGDAPSYRVVREHFDRMRQVIAEHNGSIVKTIGDAVMGAFHDPADGLAAAIDIQSETPRESESDGLVVKLGLHWGPAIVVTANGVLDYFGQTVNLAARLQKESLGGDIVVAATLVTDPRVAQAIASGSLNAEPFTASVRGLDEPVAMIRLVPKPGTGKS